MQSMRAFLARRLRWLAFMASALLFSGLANAQATTPPIKVVASFSILGDIVREVGGPDIELALLVGPDGDAHQYEPAPLDVKKLARAQVLFINGLNFETWLPRLIKSSGYQGKTVVASTGVRLRTVASHAHCDLSGHTTHARANVDPHAWQDLAHGVIYARNIAAGLVAVDPDRAKDYQRRADAYVARIRALDAEIKRTFAAIPPERRKAVTSHDAFGYFADAYGVTFIAVAELSTDTEPSAADMARIIAQVKENRVTAVFLENITSPKLVQQIARETGTKVGATLYSDALSQPGTPGASYLGMFAWNAQQIAAAMQP